MSRKFPVVRKVPLWSGMIKRFGLVGSVTAIDVYAVVDATVAASDIISPRLMVPTAPSFTTVGRGLGGCKGRLTSVSVASEFAKVILVLSPVKLTLSMAYRGVLKGGQLLR